MADPRRSGAHHPGSRHPEDLPTEHHPIVVVGGGLGGVAAALAIARAGGSVTLLEASEQLGGQMTRQAVAPFDEHALIETYGATANFRALRDGIRGHYRRATAAGTPDTAWRNPGNGWVSRLCFEPRVGETSLHELLAPHLARGRIDLRLSTRVLAVGRHGARIEHLDVTSPDRTLRLDVEVVLDATELGDLLPLAGAPWATGAEAYADTGEKLAPELAVPTRTQALTVCAVLRRDAAAGPIVPAPPGYARLRDTQPFSLDVPDADGLPRRFGVFAPVAGGPPPFWTYRRVRDAAALGGDELAVINWPGNDFVGRDLVSADDPGEVVAEARALTLAFVHWLQTEAPRDDGGRGHPELQPAPEALDTCDGLAAEPYVREARRLRARTRVLADDILPDPARGARGRTYADSGGIGWYPMDVHASVGHRDSRNDPTSPFQIPLTALVADTPTNLVAAGKAMGTTHLSNGAYRVHPVEWAIGEAAGTLAHVAVTTARRPTEVLASPELVLATQRRLLLGGAELAWVTDIPREDPRWTGVQLLAAAGGLLAPGLRDDLEVAPDRPLPSAAREHVLACLGALSRTAGRPATTTDARTFGDLAHVATATLDDRTAPHR